MLVLSGFRDLTRFSVKFSIDRIFCPAQLLIVKKLLAVRAVGGIFTPPKEIVTVCMKIIVVVAIDID